MYEFPARSSLQVLSEREWQALNAVQVTAGAMASEWEGIATLGSRLIRAFDIAEARWEGQPYQFQPHALTDLVNGALDLERTAGDITCRYAMTSVALSTALLHRVVLEQPPLPDVQVDALAAEPTVAGLQRALEIPGEVLFAARLRAGQGIEALDGLRTELLDRLDRIRSNLRAVERWKPTGQVLEETRISAGAPRNHDALWLDSLKDFVSYGALLAGEIDFAARGLAPPPAPITVDDVLQRWPSAAGKVELVNGVMIFEGAFDDRDAIVARRTYPGRRVVLNADGGLEVHPAGVGQPVPIVR